MDTKINLMFSVIRQYFPKDGERLHLTYSFTYDSYNQDNKYWCEISGGIHETDATMTYRGTGNSFEEAFNVLCQAVVEDKPVPVVMD